jgi:2-keto-4-pentenoate hydratase/2-oxohepta-3-ene-1,7-dioic acid hydratase in catechol pathway
MVRRYDENRSAWCSRMASTTTSALTRCLRSVTCCPRTIPDAGLGLRPALKPRPAPKAVPVDKARLLSPVANPGKVIAAPVNYKKHLEEALADKGIHHGNLIGEIHKVGCFLKATSAVAGAGEGVALVHTDRRNDHEVELAVVIGKTAKNVSAARALDHVAGYCIGLDMTIRGPEERARVARLLPRSAPDGHGRRARRSGPALASISQRRAAAERAYQRPDLPVAEPIA